jgi:hypothetical protein
MANSQYSEIFDLRQKALNLRSKSPEIFLFLNPQDFYSDIKLPFVKTEQVDGKFYSHYMPQVVVTKDLLRSDEKSLKAKIFANSMLNRMATPSIFFDQELKQKIIIRFSLAFLFQQELSCPLSEYDQSCPNCNLSCHKISDPKSLNLQNCRLKKIIEESFCRVERFESVKPTVN